jgi:mycofactocin system transcriptional regulator
MAQSTTQRGRGRARSTSKEELGQIGLELFMERGFDVVTVDDIARAAGIGRRTFFRYFTSKNDVPWGDFEALLESFATSLADADDVSMLDAIRVAVRAFNTVPEAEISNHRHRMRILLTTSELVAHSTVRYAAWRAVISDFVSRRLGVEDHSPVPQAVSWACLGISLAAYEQWITDDSSDLLELIDESFRAFGAIFSGGALTAGAAR